MKAKNPIQTSTAIDQSDLMRRAYAAYFRSGENMLQPDSATSGVEELNGLAYVVLRNANGVLRVYRHQHSGQLRRMRRPPKAIAEGFIDGW